MDVLGACVEGNLGTVRSLLSPRTLTLTDSERRNCLHLACFHGHIRLARYLIQVIISIFFFFLSPQNKNYETKKQKNDLEWSPRFVR